MTVFFSRLSYSFGNEDWHTEHQALRIQPQDQVLCITASGDRPLNLLIKECKKIIAVDANCTQNHLLQLKIAAMHQLDYKRYLSFLGAEPDLNRNHILEEVLARMEPEASQYWLKQKKMISKGVLYQGALERLTKIVAKMILLFRGNKVKQLFAFQDLEEQKQFVKQNWNHFFWKKAFDIALNPFISKILLKDPGLYAHIGTSVKPGAYIYNRMNASLENCLANRNLLLSLLFKGKVDKEAYSPYLSAEGVALIRPRLNRIVTKTCDIVHYLESLSEPTFDCFSLSDVASYMNKDNFTRLLRGIHKSARPGARFCLRQFLSSYDIPQEMQPYFSRDYQLEQQLEKGDRCFVYRFLVGTVIK